MNCDIDFVIELYKSVYKNKFEDMKVLSTLMNVAMYNPEKLKEMRLVNEAEYKSKVISMKELKSMGLKAKRGKK